MRRPCKIDTHGSSDQLYVSVHAPSLNGVMLHVAVLASLVIIPSKLNEPDLIEAQKLAKQIGAIAARIGKPIARRLLINEVPPALATFQLHVLDQIGAAEIPHPDALRN